jgi:hypothetical protein
MLVLSVWMLALFDLPFVENAGPGSTQLWHVGAARPATAFLQSTGLPRRLGLPAVTDGLKHGYDAVREK